MFGPEFEKRFMIKSMDAEISSRYNIAPSQEAPIIVNEGGNSVKMMRFGLIPSWSKEKKTKYNLINARAETVAKSPIFRRLLTKRRCLVPTTGFYEWRKTRSGKIPYFIRVKDEEYFALAGLWDHWGDSKEDGISSFTIITTTANQMLDKIHPRMPVILDRENEEKWLSDEVINETDLQKLFESTSSLTMKSYPVSKAVNNIRNDSKALMAPLKKK